MIAANNIKKSFGSLEVLKGVSINVAKGELVSIVGSSGAGKTTLLQILGTLETADSGTLIIDDVVVDGLSATALASFRNQKIGFVFQFHQLLPEFTALENVCIPGYIGKRDRREVEEYARYLLEILGMSHRLSHKPAALSGGEQQRVAIARALVNKPAVVLADEPSGNLDAANARELYRLFRELQANMTQTFIIVTHNKELAGLSDRILEIKDGLIFLTGHL